MSTMNFARVLGAKSNPALTTKKKERGFDIATTPPGYAHIFKNEKPKSEVNHSPLAWKVRAAGLIR